MQMYPQRGMVVNKALPTFIWVGLKMPGRWEFKCWDGV